MGRPIQALYALTLTLSLLMSLNFLYGERSWIVDTFQLTDEARYPTTVVTAYYPLPHGSKHTLDEYMTWASIFYSQIRTPIVAYLPPSNISDIIKEMRGDLPLVIKVTVLLSTRKSAVL